MEITGNNSVKISKNQSNKKTASTISDYDKTDAILIEDSIYNMAFTPYNKCRFEYILTYH
jgi:hypothetical protein